MKRLMLQSAVIAGALLLNFAFVSTVFAQGKGAGEQGSANGQPFQTLQSHIDALESNFEAAVDDLQSQIDAAVDDLQDQIGDLEASQAAQDVLISAIQTAASLLADRVAANEGDIVALQAWHSFQDQLIDALDTRLTTLEARVTVNENDIAAIILADQTTQAMILAIKTQITSLNLLIAANAGDITALQNQVASLNITLSSLQTQLLLKQARVLGVCAPGSSIRQIFSNGTVACEIDTVSAGVGTFQRLTVSGASEIPSAGLLVVGTLSKTVFCPSTHRVTGGGYEITGRNLGNPRLVQVVRTRPSGNSWQVRVWNDNVVLFCCNVDLRVFAQCGRVQ